MRSFKYTRFDRFANKEGITDQELLEYDSDIAEAIHENILAEFKLGLISAAEMRKFDKLCLTAKAYKDIARQSLLR